jgi:hypothetical protein
MPRPLLDEPDQDPAQQRPAVGRGAQTITRAAIAVAVAAAAVPLLAFGCSTRLGSKDPTTTSDIPCVNQFDCPSAPHECVISTCIDQYCAMVSASDKTVVQQQKGGDCALLVCDGRGGIKALSDPRDWPADDGNACTDETCEDGAPVYPPLEVGTKCGEDESGVCNGKGACGACLPGNKRCQGNTPEECSEDGQWASGEACPEASPICASGASCLGIAGVTAGYRATCARFQDGSLRCFGDRATGLLGASVSRVGGLYGAAQIAAGRGHTCALLRDGTAACWGSNSDGELGDKTTAARETAAPVVDIKQATQIAAGAGFSCARIADGQVKCWGRNDKGQLGDGVAKKAPGKGAGAGADAEPEDGAEGPPRPGPPTLLQNMTRVTAISLGESHGCALIAGGAVDCWGVDALGRMGGGAGAAGGAKPRAAAAKPPTLVKGLKGAVGIAAGEAHACAILEDASVACWGDNASGQLGDGSTAGKASPTKVAGIAGAVGIALGRRHSCAIVAGNSVKCWGDNASGQLGDGSTEGRTAPATVIGLSGALAISARGDHTCVSLTSRAVRCWGANSASQLGDRSTENRASPVAVSW